MKFSLEKVQEDRMLATQLRGKSIYLLLVLAIVSLTLAYQVRIPFEIDLGEPGDEAYLRGFYDIETADGLSYRWSSDRSSIWIPGVGAYAPALLRLRINGVRPEGLRLPEVTLSVNGRQMPAFTATNQFGTYEFAIDRRTVGSSGQLEVRIDTESFVPSQVMGGGDLRELGVLVDSVSLELRGSIGSLILPPPLQTAYLAGSVLAIYLVARWWVSARAATLLAIFVLLVLSLATATSPATVVLHGPWLFAASAALVAVIEIVRARPVTAPRAVTAIALVLAGAWTIGRFASLVVESARGPVPDLANNYTGAVLLRRGGPLYDLDELSSVSDAVIDPPLPWHHTSLFMSYDNPPFTALAMLPLTLLDFRTAAAVFVALNSVFLLSSAGLILWAKRKELLKYPQWLIAVILVLNFRPVYHSMSLGQFDSFTLFLIVVAFWAYRGRRDVLAGCSLGLATMMKFSPALMALYFLLKRRYTVFMSAVGVVVFLGALSWILAGPENWRFFTLNTLPALLRGCAHSENQSLSAFFSRLFLDESFITDFVEVPSVPLARFLTLSASLLLVGLTALLVRKNGVAGAKLRFDLEFALVVTTLPLLSSIAWYHYMTWYILPFLILLDPGLRRRLSLRGYLVGAIGACLAYICLNLPLASIIHVAPVGPARLLLSQGLYAGLLLYAVLSYGLLSYHRGNGDSERDDGQSRVSV